MKRIFLTSGLVLCMACPAFATGGFTGNETQQELNTGCVDDNLNTQTGPVQLRATWTNKYSTIDLDNNDTNGHASDNGAIDADPDPLYGINGDTSAVYDITGGTSDADYVFTAQSQITTPNGELWNFVYNANKPSNASNNPSTVTPTAARRAFEGFYQNADGTGSQYIDADGNITTPGKTAAGGYAADSSNTWYAKYGCAKPTLTDPTLTGWHFDGYYDQASGGNAVTSGTTCITSNNVDVYPHWTANQYRVNYVCGTSAQLTDGAAAVQGETMTQNATYDSNFTHLNGNTICSYEGRTFQSWSCVGSDGTTAVTPNSGGTWTIDDAGALTSTQNGAVTCTAVWTTNEITLNWDKNHATTVTSYGSDTCIYDQSITLPVVSRTGYTFAGWEVTAVESSVTNPVRDANTTQNP